MTEPVTKLPRRGTDLHTVTEWLDAIATGSCDETEFFRGTGELIRRAPDTGWELLALIDQYYRRGRITAEAFASLKGRLQSLLMGKNGERAPEPPQSRAPSAAAPRPAPAASPRSASAPVARATSGQAIRPASVTGPVAPKSSAARPVAAARAAPPARPLPPPSSRTSPFRASAPVDGLPDPEDDWAEHEPDVEFDSHEIDEGETYGEAFAEAYAEVDAEASVLAETGVEPATGSDFRSQRAMVVGQVLRGRYRILGVLGEGGMGTVYEAVDEYRVERTDEERRVAVKVLNSKVTHRPRLFAELRREFQHLQSLSHPNIVRVHEFDRDGDVAFFTMERLQGALLSRVLSAHRSQPMFRPYAFAIIRDVGAAVVHAHARSIVHGDVNPVNVFVTDAGEVRVLDFGTAHPLRRGPWISDFEGARQDQPMATPLYASVQLLEGETADARDDVFALACVAYELLTGRHPFREQNALKARSLRMKPSRPRGLTARQWRALRAALRFERERRPPDLQTWLAHLLPPTRTRLPSLPVLLEAAPRRRGGLGWLVAAACTAGIALAGWWAFTHQEIVSEAGSRMALTATDAVHSTDAAVKRVWAQRDTVVLDVTPRAGSADGQQPDQAVSELPRDATREPAEARIEARDGLQGAQPSAEHAPREAPAVPTPAHALNAGSPTPAVRSETGAMAGSAASRTVAPLGTGDTATGPHARVELAADTLEVVPGEPMARVLVKRSRSMRGDVSFKWWTESGTAKPGRDFALVKPEIETIPSGKNATTLFIPIVADPARRDSRSFYVVIDEPSDNAMLGRTLTMVTIPEPE